MDIIFSTRRHYQQVTIDNVWSDFIAVTSGVPQGTVLGPVNYLYE